MLTQGLNNSVDATTELEDVLGATGNGSDQENRERRIAIQLKRLDEKLKNEITCPLQVQEVREDKLATAVKLDLLTKLSKSLQNIYSDIQAMVAETCKYNEDLKRDFYDLTYHGLRAEHNDLVHRVNDLVSSQAEMSDEEKEAFKRLQQYQINRQRQIYRLELLERTLLLGKDFTSMFNRTSCSKIALCLAVNKKGKVNWRGVVVSVTLCRQSASEINECNFKSGDQDPVLH